MYNYRSKRHQAQKSPTDMDEESLDDVEAPAMSSTNSTKPRPKFFSNLPKNHLQFANEKRQALEAKFDRSKKGDLDEAIRPLVEMINADDRYYTTSCCSGRVIVSGEVTASRELAPELDSRKTTTKKKGTEWIFCAHQAGDWHADRITDLLLEKEDGEEPAAKYESVIFKFEPVIFHIRAIDLEAASVLLQAGLKAGFRNSGMVTSSSSSTSSVLVALRHTLQMEAPLVVDGRAIFTKAYVDELVKVSNRKMAANEAATFRLEGALLTMLNPSAPYSEDGDSFEGN